MTKEEVMFLIRFICLIIQIVCFVVIIVCSIRTWICKREIQRIVNNKKNRPRKKNKFYFCQWLALHCRKPVVIVYGRRRSGKTFTVLQLVKKEFKKKNRNIAVLCGNSSMARFLCDEFRYLNSDKVHFRSALKITNLDKDSCVTFYPTFDIKEAWRPGDVVPDILIADNCDDPIRFVGQHKYYNDHFANWNVKKVFITAIPMSNVCEQKFYDMLGKKNVKIFRWGLNCGPRLPKEFIREAKLKIKEADFNNEIKGGL